MLSLPGAIAFSGAAFVARMPISMLSLGIVLLVAGRTGSYGYAGGIAAAYILANAVAAPVQGRLTDRLGQARVLPVSITIYGVALAALMAAVQGDAPVPLPHLIAVLVGVALPQVGSSVRARRAHAGDAREPLGWRILLPVALTATALGTLFGSTEVVTVAFTEQLGRQVLAGPLLATWALGSLLAGVATGSVPRRASPTRRRRGGGGARPGVAADRGHLVVDDRVDGRDRPRSRRRRPVGGPRRDLRRVHRPAGGGRGRGDGGALCQVGGVRSPLSCGGAGDATGAPSTFRSPRSR